MALINGQNSWTDRDSIGSYYGDDTTGNDTINLLDGDDYADGGLGNDTINGGYGRDYIDGSEGNDLIRGDDGDDGLDGGAGVDTLYGGYGDDDLYGDSYYPSGQDKGDKLYGGEGSDSFYGGAGGDSMFGGNGDDFFRLGEGGEITGDVTDGGTGIDRLEINYKLHYGPISFMATDYLAGYQGAGNLTIRNVEEYRLRGSDSADTLGGWEMDDEIQGGWGADRLYGKGGEDTLHGGHGGDTLEGGNGDDYLSGDTKGYFDWDEDADVPTPFGADVIWAGRGDDQALGGAMNDRIYGGEGNDKLDGENGNDRVEGGQGRDTMTGGYGRDVLIGGMGDDELYSSGYLDHENEVEYDVLEAGAGSDRVWAGVGDRAIGGDGTAIDTLAMTFGYVSANNTGVTYNLATQGQILTTLANGTKVDGFEVLEFYGGDGTDRVTGGSLNDKLEGGRGGDFLYGGGGQDYLDGRDGSDRLFGGAGNDTFHDNDDSGARRADAYFGGLGADTFNDGYGADRLEGNDGADLFKLGAYLRSEDYLADTVVGGSGYDRVEYADSDGSVRIDLAAQGKNGGTARGDVLQSIEHITGSAYDDYLLGNEGANAFNGGGKDDVLNGRGGSDVLIGGAGADALTGGGGRDTFVLERDDGFLSHDTYWPHDVITDFRKGEDKLAVFESEFQVDFDTFRIVNQTTNSAKTAGPTFVFETDTHRLWFDEDGRGKDTDGDGVVDQNLDAILLTSITSVTSLDRSHISFFE